MKFHTYHYFVRLPEGGVFDGIFKSTYKVIDMQTYARLKRDLAELFKQKLEIENSSSIIIASLNYLGENEYL